MEPWSETHIIGKDVMEAKMIKRKLVDYRLLDARTLGKIDDLGNSILDSLTRKGYELYSGPTTNGYDVYQAMVLYEEVPDKNPTQELGEALIPNSKTTKHEYNNPYKPTSGTRA